MNNSAFCEVMLIQWIGKTMKKGDCGINVCLHLELLYYKETVNKFVDI